MNVRHATLHDVYGRPARHDGFTFVPGRIEFDGTAFEPSHHLRELPADRIPPVLRLPVERQFDVSWVRARIPRVFGFTPEPAETEKTFLSVGFVAVPNGGDEGIAFECSDYYGKTSLTFSGDERDGEMKRKLAEAFWGVLASEPDDLADFSGWCFHSGAGVWMNFGCANGEPYFFESESGGS